MYTLIVHCCIYNFSGTETAVLLLELISMPYLKLWLLDYTFYVQILCLDACVNVASVTHAGRSFLLRLHFEFLPRKKRVC